MFYFLDFQIWKMTSAKNKLKCDNIEEYDDFFFLFFFIFIYQSKNIFEWKQ